MHLVLISFLFVVTIFLSSQSRRRCRAATRAATPTGTPEAPIRQSRRHLGLGPSHDLEITPGRNHFARFDNVTKGTTQGENAVGLAMVAEVEKEEEEQEAIVEEEEKEEEEKEEEEKEEEEKEDESDSTQTDESSEEENGDEEDAVEEPGESGSVDLAEASLHCVFMLFCKHDFFSNYNIFSNYNFFSNY